MSFTSLAFWLLSAACISLYWLCPVRCRGYLLLVISFVYYAAAGPALLLYLLFAAVATFFGGKLAAKGSRAGVAATLLAVFGMLAYLKYANFLISGINLIFKTEIGFTGMLLPLGISFYTFQSAGYLLDVYWKRTEPESDFFRYLLFVSFFPQLMQGPIGRYASLAPQLFADTAFDADRLRRGAWRIAWGFFKKMVVADNAALYVNSIFNGFSDLKSLSIQGVLMYSIQLYADFSGGIDVALGIGEMMGIRLDENFRQPYFAVSLTDFWHRWHITLGTWMKDYLFYPISLSGWMGGLRRRCRKIFGKEAGRTIPVAISNIIVFLVVGIWHGSAWHFILFGLFHGLVIAGSALLTPSMRRWKKALHIPEKAAWFHLFQILRTFIIVNISWFFDRSESVSQAFSMLRFAFCRPFFSVSIINPQRPGVCMIRFLTIAAGCAVIFTVSLLKERGTDVRGTLLRRPAVLRGALMIALILLCAALGNTDDGGFIYANF